MTNPVFSQGWREQMFARIALSGPAGSGKTLTAFTLARALSSDGRFAVIDTERRAREYGLLRTDDPNGRHPHRFAFGHMIPDRADPEKLPELVGAAAREGYGALVVDSFSHYWSGFGGALDRVDRKPDKRAGWNEYRSVEAAMMQSLLNFPGHVIMTMRVKTEYVVEESATGRKTSRRVGLKPDQRDTVDYEFSIMGEMDDSHTLTVVKTTCQELVDRQFPRPGQELADILQQWLGQGEPALTPQQIADRVIGTATAVENKATAAEIANIYREQRHLLMAPVIDELNQTVRLGDLLVRLGSERRAQDSARHLSAVAV